MQGFRICQRKQQVDAKWLPLFSGVPVANISDVMSRMTAGGSRIRPYYTGPRMVGVALTVKARPGDNLMVHKALDLAGPGDVVVVDAGGDLTNAIIGELMSTHAKYRGLAGIVINGAIRDSDTLIADNFPVFAAGVTHRGPYKDGPGEINVPIAIDGMVIHPGDLICGDADGMLAVPYAEVETIYQKASGKHSLEEEMMAAIKNGTSDRAWVDAALARLGCTFE